MASIPNWLALSGIVLLYGAAVLGLRALERTARRYALKRRAGVEQLLANPDQLQRVWYVQQAEHSHPQLLLRGRDHRGNVVTLAFPREAPQVWHQLQLAGILVHPGP